MLPRTSPSALGRIANGNLAHKANVRSITASAGLRCPRHHDNATDSAASVGGLVFSRKRSQVCLHHGSLIIVLIDELKAALQKLKPKRSLLSGQTSPVFGRRAKSPTMIGSISGGIFPPPPSWPPVPSFVGLSCL